MDLIKDLFKEFGWFIWGLVALGFIWFMTGGLENESARQGAFIKPLAPLDTGETYGNYYAGSPRDKRETLDLPEAPADLLRKVGSTVDSFFEEAEEAKKVHVSSLLAKKVSFDGPAAARAKTAESEYVRIIASEFAEESTNISGLLLRGYGYGTSILIPKAAEFPLLGVPPIKSDVVMPPGGRALISSARSPIGTSFRVSICTGYLDQFQRYTPDLIKDCPSPIEELAKTELTGEDACIDFVKSLPRCRIFQGNLPAGISSACKVFVTEQLNFNSCSIAHKSEDGFYSDEWRLFLNQSEELWSDRNEIIKLIDSKGNTLDAITY